MTQNFWVNQMVFTPPPPHPKKKKPQNCNDFDLHKIDLQNSK